MHISFPHPDHLETRRGRTAALSMLTAGSVVVSFGLWVGFQLAKVTQLKCDRTPQLVNCQWQEHGFFHDQRRTINYITQAQVEMHKPLNPMYRLQLQTAEGQHSFPHYYIRDKSKMQALADQVNAFIPNQESPNLSVQLDRRRFGWVWGGGLVLLGLWGWYDALWRSKIHVFRVDRSRGVIQVEYRSLIRHCRTNQYFLKDVVATQIHQSRSDVQPQFSLFLRTGDVLVLQVPHYLDGRIVQMVLEFWGAIAQEVSR